MLQFFRDQALNVAWKMLYWDENEPEGVDRDPTT